MRLCCPVYTCCVLLSIPLNTSPKDPLPILSCLVKTISGSTFCQLKGCKNHVLIRNVKLFKRLSNMLLPMSYWVHSSYSSHKFWLKIIVATMIFSSVCFRHIIVLCKSRCNVKMWTWTLSAICSLITLHCILYESEVARCRARQAPGSSSTVMWWSDPGLPAACRAREWASDSNTAEREREKLRFGLVRTRLFLCSLYIYSTYYLDSMHYCCWICLNILK